MLHFVGIRYVQVILCSLLCFFISEKIRSQELLISKGEIIDTISIGNTSESYALYLPTRYNPKVASSIVFIFEPLGRGPLGIQLFVPSAEKYNHILVCSNNAKNGPFQENFDIANRLFASVFETLTIDQNQIYLAGFSGGSRLASSIAVLTKQIQGVIACGAGFSPNSFHQPSFGDSFSYVGLVGNRDMNYQEMQQTEKWLTILKLPNALFINEDNHRWPPPVQLDKAFAWLELRAYDKNLKPKDFEKLSQMYHSFYADGRAEEDNNNLVRAVNMYELIVDNFSKYYKTDSIRSKINTIKHSIKYKQALEIKQQIVEEEKKVQSEFDAKFELEVESKNAKPNLKWWSKKLKKLNEDYLRSEHNAKKAMGERVSYSLYALAIETGANFLRNKKYDKALYCHQLLTVIVPERAFPYVLVAKDYATLGQAELAIFNLKTAFKKGVQDRAEILRATEFDSLRQLPEFMELVENE